MCNNFVLRTDKVQKNKLFSKKRKTIHKNKIALSYKKKLSYRTNNQTDKQQ